ncbi:MAG TPA: indolepyruvate oxidoreductase subunit beta [Ruminococcaceae bacterium]|jgi:indolepyruvate ferredoxin oxidoreductase beta subunit|nr:indolepyruvate oxidoreductase subunit beta [Oscillospiraceae bacterium]HCA28344.1 indolepyruvate oxidoreductase subunit beta [Oscillospiraceae bacterium]
MSQSVKNIMIVGVGGQGTLLASKLMGKAFVEKGYDVKVSEVHGMSQRGGSVVTYVRYGEKVYSPLIDKGEADIIIAFEQLEAARWLAFLKPGGILITSTQKIDPMPVIMGNAVYPQELLSEIKEKDVEVIAVDALSLAVEAGSPRATNIVLLGVAAHFLGFDREVWEEVIRSTVPPKTITINEKAFALGFAAKE